MFAFDEQDEEYGIGEGQCLGCDTWGRVDDLGLCEKCGAKFERDMLRLRNWDYSATAFGLPPAACEEARRQVIAEFGQALELVTEEVPPQERHHSGRRKKRRHRR